LVFAAALVNRINGCFLTLRRHVCCAGAAPAMVGGPAMTGRAGFSIGDFAGADTEWG